MSGSEPGGVRKRARERDGEAEGGRGLCTSVCVWVWVCVRVCVCCKVRTWRRGRAVSLSGQQRDFSPIWTLLTQALPFFFFSFVAEWSCFNLIWLRSKRPSGSLGLRLDRPSLFRDGQHVCRVFFFFLFLFFLSCFKAMPHPLSDLSLSAEGYPSRSTYILGQL